MQRLVPIAVLGAALAVLALPNSAVAHDALVAKHAGANGVPESLVRRVIQIESRGNARAVSKGNFGLMQIRLGTAKAMGYSGGAEGLLDADTNMTYAVKYLAGAYRAAGGNEARAISYYQRGYYYQAKAQGFSPYDGAARVTVVTAEPPAASTPAPRGTVADGTATSTVAALEAVNAGASAPPPRQQRAQQQAKRDAPAVAAGPLALLAEALTSNDAKPPRKPKQQRAQAMRAAPQQPPLY